MACLDCRPESGLSLYLSHLVPSTDALRCLIGWFYIAGSSPVPVISNLVSDFLSPALGCQTLGCCSPFASLPLEENIDSLLHIVSFSPIICSPIWQKDETPSTRAQRRERARFNISTSNMSHMLTRASITMSTPSQFTSSKLYARKGSAHAEYVANKSGAGLSTPSPISRGLSWLRRFPSSANITTLPTRKSSSRRVPWSLSLPTTSRTCLN